jgi:GNAT superfamily N-acetyltransferase
VDLQLRTAAPADFAALQTIARSGGSPDSDHRYFDFVRSVGRLVVATADEVVIGFAGAVPVRYAVMICDLFVDPAWRARGAGRLLLETMVDGCPSRITFSSPHPAALHLYAAFGMPPGERLLTMEGVGGGSGTPLLPGRWQHDRHDLVSYFGRSGALITDHSVVRRSHGVLDVLRVQGEESQRALADLIAAAGASDTITLSILDSHPLLPWLLRQGFAAVDHDVRCSSPDVDPTTVATCVHRGLC